MNLDERENYNPEEQYFQDDETRYDDVDIDAPPADHSISDNAEPDYGNEFEENAINNPELDQNAPGGDEFDEEFDDEDDYEDDEDLDDTDFDEDEEGTDPNRNL